MMIVIVDNDMIVAGMIMMMMMMMMMINIMILICYDICLIMAAVCIDCCKSFYFGLLLRTENDVWASAAMAFLSLSLSLSLIIIMVVCFETKFETGMIWMKKKRFVAPKFESLLFFCSTLYLILFL